MQVDQQPDHDARVQKMSQQMKDARKSLEETDAAGTETEGSIEGSGLSDDGSASFGEEDLSDDEIEQMAAMRQANDELQDALGERFGSG